MISTDVGLSILDPFTGETFAAEPVAPLRETAVPAPQSVCRFPIPGLAVWRLCMLPTGHGGTCLPVPRGRGLAIR